MAYCFEKNMGVPLTTHNILLPLIAQCLNVFDEICRLVFNFIFSCCYSKYKLISDVAFHGLENAGYSLIGSNFSFVSRHFGFKRLSKITAHFFIFVPCYAIFG
jgi:hypothetical protein